MRGPTFYLIFTVSTPSPPAASVANMGRINCRSPSQSHSPLLSNIADSLGICLSGVLISVVDPESAFQVNPDPDPGFP
jgi:hypothetical protein